MKTATLKSTHPRIGYSDCRTVYIQYIRDGIATVRSFCGALADVPVSELVFTTEDAQ